MEQLHLMEDGFMISLKHSPPVTGLYRTGMSLPHTGVTTTFVELVQYAMS